MYLIDLKPFAAMLVQRGSDYVFLAPGAYHDAVLGIVAATPTQQFAWNDLRLVYRTEMIADLFGFDTIIFKPAPPVSGKGGLTNPNV